MNNARAIALKFCAIRMAGLRIFSAARIARSLGKRRKRGALRCFHFVARLVAVSMFAGPNAAMATGDRSEARLRRSLPGCRHFHAPIIR